MITDKQPSSSRIQISNDAINQASLEVRDQIQRRLEQKGFGTFASRHETLGIVTEEYHELVEAVHTGTLLNIRKELEDLAVAAIFGVACISKESLEW